MAAILKVRDADGTVHEIHALQGKTAYQYAQDGGYTGSEEDFRAKLASDWIAAPAAAAVGQTIRVSAVDENGRPTDWEAVDMASGDTWDVHYKANIPEALESGFEITEVDGVPLQLKEMYAMVKIQNGSSSTAWTGCTITTDTGVSIFGTASSAGGVNLNADGYAYFVYHVKILPGSDRYFGQCTSSSSTAFVNNNPWLNNWLDYNKVNYFTGIKCTNNLGAGTSQGYGTEIEIWGKTK